MFRKVNPLVDEHFLFRIGTQEVDLGPETAH